MKRILSTIFLISAIWSFGQLPDYWVPTTGSANTYTATITPAKASSKIFHVKFNVTNTGASTLTISNGTTTVLNAVALRYWDGTAWTALPSGHLDVNTVYKVSYNGTYLLLESFGGGGGGSGTVTSIATSNGLIGGTITTSGTISGVNAQANASTKGVSTYVAGDFNDNGSGTISLDYANGQKATGSQDGFLSSTNWSTFNGKQNAISLTTNGNSGVSTFDGTTLNVPNYTSAPAATSLLGVYKINTSSTTAPVSSGHLVYNNGTQTSATSIFVSHLTDDGIDIDLFLGLLKTNDVLVVQDESLSDNYQYWTISGTPSLASNTWTIPVTFESSGGTGTTGFTNNTRTFLATFSSAPQYQLSDLTDTNINNTNPLTASDALVWDGSQWINDQFVNYETDPSVKSISGIVKSNGSTISAAVAGTDYQSPITFGTNVQTALGVNIGSAGAPVLFNGAGGTPTSLTLTNATGLPVSTGISGLGTGVSAWLATPSWTNFNSAITGTAPFWSLGTTSQTLTGNLAFAGSSSNRLAFNFSTLGANSGVTINSTATDAASNTQKALEVLQSGINGTSSQSTYAGYFSNVKTGGGSNYGIYATASGGTNNRAIYASGAVEVDGASLISFPAAANITFPNSTASGLIIGDGTTNFLTFKSTSTKTLTAATNVDFTSDIQLNGSSGTANYVMTSQGAGVDPTWSQVSLSAGVTGDLPFTNLTQGSALSVLGVTGNATADMASIAAGSDFNVLRRSGTSLAFGSIDLSQSGAVGSSVLKIANGGTNLSSTPTNGQVLIGNGTGYSLSTLTAGSNVTITNGSGTITIAASGGSGSTDLAFSGSSSPVTLTSSSGTDVNFVAGSGVTLSATATDITISSTGGGSGLTYAQVKATSYKFK